jgi:hypothetical protein
MRTHINTTLVRLNRVKGQYGFGLFCDRRERKCGFQVASFVFIIGGKG